MECLYCDRNQNQKDLMIEVCDLQISTVFLFKEQTYRGRLVLAFREHARELYELNDSELLAFMQDANRAAKVMKQLFNPVKINYGAYSDKLPHLHIHLVPKYADGTDFGGVFQMNPQKVYLTEKEYAEIVDRYKKELKKDEKISK